MKVEFAVSITAFTQIVYYLTFMATRRRTSATRKTAKSAATVKEVSTSVKKSPTTRAKRVNKVTPIAKNVVTEVTESKKVDTLSLEKLFRDYPRDGFSLALLPFLLLEAGTKEVLRYAGTIK